MFFNFFFSMHAPPFVIMFVAAAASALAAPVCWAVSSGAWRSNASASSPFISDHDLEKHHLRNILPRGFHLVVALLPDHLHRIMTGVRYTVGNIKILYSKLLPLHSDAQVLDCSDLSCSISVDAHSAPFHTFYWRLKMCPAPKCPFLRAILNAMMNKLWFL
jgi:hypothetical protein